VRIIASLLLGVLLLSGCGGGGGGGTPTSITVSPNAVNFITADTNAPIPGQVVQASFDGDGVVVAYPPGTSVPSWLQLESVGHGTSTADFRLLAYAGGLGPGKYSTSLRFLTGRLTSSGELEDAKDISHFDITVTLTVSDLAVSPQQLSFTAIQGSDAPAQPVDSRSFAISGSNLEWTASSDQGWLTLAKTQGNTATTVGFSLSPAALPAGTHHANITVRNATGESRSMAVNLQVRAPQIRIAPASLAFAVTGESTDSTLQQDVSISDELDGQNPALGLKWSVAGADQPWLSAGPASGTTAPAAAARLTIGKAALAGLPNGFHTAQVTFNYEDASGGRGSVALPVSLHLNVPRPSFIAPRIAVAGKPAALLLRGSGFTYLKPEQISCGGQAPESLTVIHDSATRVTCPATAAGEYAVTIASIGGTSRAPWNIKVLNSKSRAAAIVAVTGIPGRVVFDDERETLYVVNTGNARLERYRYDGTSWRALPSLSMPALQDATQSFDGRRLYVTAGAALFTLDITDPEATPIQVTQAPDPTHWFDKLALASGGTSGGVVIMTVDSSCCSGTFPFYQYFPNGGTLGTFPFPVGDDGPMMAGSADGSVVHISGGYDQYRYNSLSGTLDHVGNGFDTTAPYVTAVNRDGSLLTNMGDIYDRQFQRLGTLEGSASFVAFGLGSKRSYSYAAFESRSAQELLISDLGGALTPEGTFPIVARVRLAWSPNMTEGDLLYARSTPVAVSADEKTAFIRGVDKLVIQPLP